MKQIRHNVFETNSSSTHSIAVPRKYVNYDGRSIYFDIDEFGWSNEEANPADYLYTAIFEQHDSVQKFLDQLVDILNRHNINYVMEEPVLSKYGTLENGYVDHGGELYDFISYLLASDDRTLAFIFDGLVFTGNDNSDSQFINRTEEFYEAYEFSNGKCVTHKEVNPYYMPNWQDYEWHYKGN